MLNNDLDTGFGAIHKYNEHSPDHLLGALATAQTEAVEIVSNQVRFIAKVLRPQQGLGWVRDFYINWWVGQGAMRDAELKTSSIVIEQLDIAKNYNEHAKACWDVWEKGYGLLHAERGVFYVYASLEQLPAHFELLLRQKREDEILMEKLGLDKRALQVYLDLTTNKQNHIDERSKKHLLSELRRRS